MGAITIFATGPTKLGTLLKANPRSDVVVQASRLPATLRNEHATDSPEITTPSRSPRW
jgi:hypothetical protein